MEQIKVQLVVPHHKLHKHIEKEGRHQQDGDTRKLKADSGIMARKMSA